MIPHAYKSGASAQIASFVRSRMAAGAMSKGQEARLHQFDEFCAREFPDSAALTQGMVDAWAERRPTESANSCIVRCGTVISLVRFLRARGETDVTEPETPRPEGRSYVPHAFTDDELRRFFAECDSWVPGNNMAKRVRVRTQRTMPVIFRLLWSSGIRTCEARRLRVEHVDLGEGVLRIVGGKGMRERLVALNESMLPLMREYDDAMEAIYPGRDYFFPNGTHGHISAGTLCDWFRKLWTRVSDEPATAYELRHCFCVTCINELVGRGTDGLAGLVWVSKAMGHSSVDVTIRHYYHIVPALAQVLQDRSGEGFDGIVPGVM